MGLISKRILFLIVLNNFVNVFECKQSVCEFNQLCICSNHSQRLSEVICLGVNIRLSEISVNHYYRIRIIGAPDLMAIRNNDLSHMESLSSLTISRSSLSSVEAFAFIKSGVVQTLTTLELSYSSLREFPTFALLPLHRLQWLSLKANKIEELKAKDLKDITSLRSLLLSDNSLSIVRDHTFEGLPSLEFLDLDDNMITRVEGTPFPPSLTTLSMSNCLLEEVPVEAMANVPNLQSIQLRGNLIEHIPRLKFSTNNLQVLDLSHNIISNISGNAFALSPESQNQNPYNPLKVSPHFESGFGSVSNANMSYVTLRIRDLHLDFNFIQSLPSGLFAHISCHRLSLSNNRISSSFISDQAFDGPIKDELKALDLNYNLIDSYPNAIKTLRNVRQILLKNNRLKTIDENAFFNCGHSLEVLDLSRNSLSEIPYIALRSTKTLIRLSLYGNSISTVEDNHLEQWSQTLISLSLAKNSIRYISRYAFRYANNLRELRLSGNELMAISPDLLAPLKRLDLLDLSDSLNYVVDRPVIQSVSIDSMKSVKWLSLDYNRLRNSGSSKAFKAFKGLMHLDLENNEINDLGENEFIANSNISTIILSRNQLSIIRSNSFAHLPHLENIGLYLNQIKTIESKAFQSLSKLKTIILSKNYINRIQFQAFYNLSQTSASLSILLDENRLKCFSADIFGSDIALSRRSQTFLYINVSHNEIKQLSGCGVQPSEQIYINESKSVSSDHSSEQTVSVRLLDLSHNQIETIPNTFIDRMCKSLHSLHVNHNKLKAFPLRLLQMCPQIQILILSHNLIEDKSDFTNETFVSDLQVLSLRDNRIKSLIDLIPILKKLSNLRQLDLSHNSIANIPQNAFSSTLISRLYLSNNMLTNFETNSGLISDSETECFGVKSSLKYLDLSHNYLNSVSPRVMSCENLIELKLANNVIAELSMRSETQFIAFIDLRQIDISYNPIKKIDNKWFLSGLKSLNVLKLNNISLSSLPTLNLPDLTHLELSSNLISSLEPKTFAITRSLRYLDISRNRLQDVPRHIWRYITKLQTLLLQYNPIDVLDTSSFQELKHLRHLDIRGLDLQYIDTRLLHNHRYLVSIKSSTYPNVRSFRLHDLLAKTSSLRSASIEVEETTLSHQIQWAFGTKLKELTITGSKLVHIFPDAFLGLYNTYDLTLRVTDTNISSLPSGLLKYLADIRFITIDLRRNQLKTLRPEVFLDKSENILESNWNSQQIFGGILLDDNPLKCDCDLIWISDWMKRLISDMRLINIEAALQANTLAAMSQCVVYQNNFVNHSEPKTKSTRRMPIIDIRSEDVLCESTSKSSPSIAEIILLVFSINRLCSHIHN